MVGDKVLVVVKDAVVGLAFVGVEVVEVVEVVMVCDAGEVEVVVGVDVVLGVGFVVVLVVGA